MAERIILNFLGLVIKYEDGKGERGPVRQPTPQELENARILEQDLMILRGTHPFQHRTESSQAATPSYRRHGSGRRT
jgi:hypothetical protein